MTSVFPFPVALPRFDDIYLEPYQASNNSTPAMGLQLDAIKPDERERFIRMFRSNSSPDGFMEGKGLCFLAVCPCSMSPNNIS